MNYDRSDLISMTLSGVLIGALLGIVLTLIFVTTLAEGACGL